jgi:hypothetical protein
MAHVAQALFILFLVSAAAVLLARAGGMAARILYTRPLVLWTLTLVGIATALISTGRWRSIDGRGLLHFITVAVVAFVALTILCRAPRMLRRLFATRR